ncbi:uncharacterized protein LOC136040374 [Artemia franciscana]|uniref:uncharacterized protein LOC136040374 n=1 Tax=Artemia franciscana TaxID=6661 RepID=UPI0032DA5923
MEVNLFVFIFASVAIVKNSLVLCINIAVQMFYFVYFITMKFLFIFHARRIHSSRPLKECSCCQKIKLPGECKARPFLQASEKKLFELITNQNSVLDIENLFVFPEVITKIGHQEEHGFKAEYRVYEELKKSKLHAYMFYSPTMKKKELGDFLFISKSSVIIVEVKAFKLKDNPTKENYETLKKKLSDYKKQENRVIRDIKVFLTRHNCNYNVDLFHSFIVFPNTKRSQIPKETEWIPKNVLFQEDYPKRLFQEEYSNWLFQLLNKVKKMILKNKESRLADENNQYTLRTILAWCYGSYLSSLSTPIEYQACQWNIWRELEKCLNKEYRVSKTEIDGIFLTPMQKLIVECDHPFLEITGMPGTGKTYCLILKMVRVFIELWQLHREQNHKEKELIIVYHRNERTIRFIKEMFQRLVENQMGRIDNMKEIQKFIIFLGGKNCQDIDTEEIFEVRQYDTRKRFKIFFDDVNWDYFSPFYGEAGATGMLYILRQSNFCWYTSYNNICALMNQFRPKEMRAYQYWPSIYHRVHLTDSLRYTGNIHTLLNQLHARSRGFSPGFSPGTRIVGEKPHFVSVRDCRAMEVKVHELLKKFDKEEIKRDEIAVIKTESWMNMVKDELRMDMNRARKKFIDFKNEAASLLCALGISYDHLEIEDAHSLSFFREIDSKMNDFNSKENTKFSLRGMEFRHVILCVTPKPKSFSDEDRLVSIKEELKNKGLNETHKFIQMLENESKRWEMYRSLDLVEAISRAIASVTIVYTDGDVLLSEIAEQIENASPEICPKNTYNKTYEMGEIIKEGSICEAINMRCLADYWRNFRDLTI